MITFSKSVIFEASSDKITLIVTMRNHLQDYDQKTENLFLDI